MDEELSLPPLITDSHNDSSSFNLRKRARLSSPAISLSSDPPIFSSDDDPSADNYTNVRRKKIYRGPWFRQELVDGKEKSKRTLQRQIDSGVFMGSDGSDFSDAVEPCIEVPTRSRLGALGRRLELEKPHEPTQEELAEKYIEQCLDRGEESIGLMDWGLSTLSEKAIQLLSTFTCASAATGATFHPFEPKLKLLLSTNNFVKVPREIFNLQHLHVLSLRANELRELSPAISQLKRLVELNIANNSLRYLPFEILQLFGENSNLREFNIHPNPYYEPEIPTDANTGKEPSDGHPPDHPGLSATAIDPSSSEKWRTSHCFSSPVRFFRVSGKLAKGPVIPCDDEKPGDKNVSSLSASGNRSVFRGSIFSGSQETKPANVIQKVAVAKPGNIQCPPENRTSAAPSLLEVALQACYRSRELPYLADELIHSDTPSYFYDLLNKAQTLKKDGGQKCTVCGRSFIIARTEWIEWWEISKLGNRNGSMASAASPLRVWENTTSRDQIEALVPLIRRGCSWKCYEQTPTRDAR